eukprot:863398-Amphidinium_carterae.3
MLRSALNAACGGLWMNDRIARVYDDNPTCPFCHEAEGTASHTLYDCPAFASQRKEAQVAPRREDIPACVRVFGLGIQLPTPLPTIEELPSEETQDEILVTAVADVVFRGEYEVIVFSPGVLAISV